MPEPATGKRSMLREFPRTFWAANVMELFERGAYYGMNSVLAVYLTKEAAEGGLGFDKGSVGFLQATVYALTYVVPILGGALAERLGYRRMLMVAFCFMTAGYLAISRVSTYGLVFLFLMCMATGSGLFKPIISGTIARTTNKENGGFGFGVYYWMINLGAFVAPLVVSVIKGYGWRWVFVASGIYVALMFLPAILVYRDPERPETGKGIGEFVSGMFTVLRDSRFMLMIFFYSTFWILYFQNFGTVLWYMDRFIDPAPIDGAVNRVLDGTLNAALAWAGAKPVVFVFDVEHVTVINAGTIIALQVLVSRIVRNLHALPTMIAGVLMGSMGFLILALTSSAWLFVLGIAVFSIGEMTCHPKYYSYIGIVAPKDRVAIYMGYAFFYGIIGSGIGSNAGAVAYEYLLAHGGSVKPLWWICSGLGVCSCLALVLYNAVFARDTPEANRRARVVVGVVYALLALGGSAIAWSVASNPPIAWKHVVSSGLMVLIGMGGLVLTLTGSAAHPAGGRGEESGAGG